MEAPPCQSFECQDPTIEDSVITHDRGLPNLDYMIRDQVSTMDDCFEDMEKVLYGGRVKAKLVDDQSCEDPRYEAMCKEMEDQNRILFEEDCQSPGYMFLIFIHTHNVSTSLYLNYSLKFQLITCYSSLQLYTSK